MPKKVLIFDFDGTIADSLQQVVRIFNALSSKYGYAPVLEKDVESLRGNPARDIVAALGISRFKLPLILIEGKREFGRSVSDVKVFPEIKNILLRLSKDYKLGIVTSNSKENVEDFLEKNNLKIFDFVYSDKSLMGKSKVIDKLLKKYDFDPNSVIYIGDEVRDIIAAKKSNIKIISVSWGFNTKEVLLKNNPDAVVDNLEQLIAAIKVVSR